MPSAKVFRLGFLVHDVSRLRRSVVDKVMKPKGMTLSQWWVLISLSESTSRELMQTELANELDIGKVNLGGLLDRLERAGYIVRKADPVDRRAKRIVMTAKGLETVYRLQGQAAQLNREMLKGITAEEVRKAEDVLNRLRKRLIAMEHEIKPEELK